MSSPCRSASKGPFSFPEPADLPQPYELKVDQDFIDVTLRKVRDWRPPQTYNTEWTREGPPVDELTKIQDFWLNQYDFNAVLGNINKSFHHYATWVSPVGRYTGDKIGLHFIHERSSNPNAEPILLLHGWPSTSLEWTKVIPSLRERYHIIAPDLPGFGFSLVPSGPNLGPREMGQMFNELMHQLGYSKYGLISTDLGWIVGNWMVVDLEAHITGHFSDFVLAPATDEDRKRGEYNSHIASMDAWFQNFWTYAEAHAKIPQALAMALADSPMGFLAWIWNINNSTSDGFKPEMEQQITDCLMLWMPGVFANIRAYRECFDPEIQNPPYSNVPTGASEWGWSHGPWKEVVELPFAPEEWLKRKMNLVWFRRHERGGHFPAVTLPKVWSEDALDFFGQVHSK